MIMRALQKATRRNTNIYKPSYILYYIYLFRSIGLIYFDGNALKNGVLIQLFKQ